ncbi:MAG: hypothetical protein AB7R89_04110 [Dehalococcoidia bacterium]
MELTRIAPKTYRLDKTDFPATHSETIPRHFLAWAHSRHSEFVAHIRATGVTVVDGDSTTLATPISVPLFDGR